MAQTEPSGTETPQANAQRDISVEVVDDHESVRLGLKAAFIDEGYNFVLAAATVKELVEGLNGREIDVVVLDRHRQRQKRSSHWISRSRAQHRRPSG